ncbi:hypothetical protein Efla_003589 [Eimeria flavescens]
MILITRQHAEALVMRIDESASVKSSDEKGYTVNDHFGGVGNSGVGRKATACRMASKPCNMTEVLFFQSHPVPEAAWRGALGQVLADASGFMFQAQRLADASAKANDHPGSVGSRGERRKDVGKSMRINAVCFAWCSSVLAGTGSQAIVLVDLLFDAERPSIRKRNLAIICGLDKAAARLSNWVVADVFVLEFRKPRVRDACAETNGHHGSVESSEEGRKMSEAAGRLLLAGTEAIVRDCC